MVVESGLLQSLKDLPDRPVDLHNDIAVQAAPGFAFVFVGHEQRHMRYVVRQVKEEWPVLVLINESEPAFRVPGGQVALIRVVLNGVVSLG